MSTVRLRGFKIFRDKKPPYKQRCYHRATGLKVDLDAAPIGSAAFLDQCHRIAALHEAAKAREPRPGTLGGLIAAYQATEHFRDLAPRTRKDYQRVANYLASIADTPAQQLKTPLIAAIHDRAAKKLGWRQANMLRTFLVQVFKYCIPLGLTPDGTNPVSAVIPKPRPKDRPRANRPWQGDELQVVLTRAPARLAAGVALMAFTGLDPSDALTLRRDQIKGGVIRVNRAKTTRAVQLPITGQLAELLAKATSHDAITVLASAKGRPWTLEGFQTAWDRFKRAEAEAERLSIDLTLKGLRHTVATILREEGTALRQIADYLGQSESSMAAWYSRDADLTEANRPTAEKLAAGIKARTKIVKPGAESVKPPRKDAAK